MLITFWFLLCEIVAISKSELQKILNSDEYNKKDQSWSSFDSFKHEFRTFDGNKVVKVTPHIGNIPVINGARLLTLKGDDWKIWFAPPVHSELVLEPSLSPIEALSKLNEFIGHDRISDSRVLHDRALIHSEFDKIHPVYRYFDSISNRVWVVSGIDGHLIRSYTTVNHEQAFVFPIGQYPSFGTRPPLATVPSTGSVIGINSIKNTDFASLNTCFAYKCRGRSDSNCLPQDAICVDPKPGLKEGSDYFTSTSYFTVPGQTFDFEKDWQSLGYQNGSVWLAWVNSPVAASRISYPADQVWGSDFNWETYSGYEQDDSINELQAFYYLNMQAQFLRNLTGDATFCFIGAGPNCTLTSETPSSNISALFSAPIHFITNLVSLSTSPGSSSQFPSFDVQFNQGLGKTKENPIFFDQYSDYDNAYYSRQPFANNSINCTDAGCVDVNSFQFTSIGFGQSLTSRDWALNECVVYHELVHALVAQYIPDIGYYTWADSGLRSDPGAMNEGWADYFAAIHCGISDFTKTYNGHPKRNLDNSRTCADSVGEVHTDGQIFAGALWNVRSQIPKTPKLSSDDQPRFDKLILQSISLGRATDLFADQFDSILSLLQEDSKLSPLVPFAKDEFTVREFGCVREFVFEESSDPTFTLPENVLTPVNLSTIPAQIKFRPRKSDWAVYVKWRQFANDGRLGKLDIGFAKQPMQLLISPCPIYLERRVNTSGDIDIFSNCSESGQKTEISFTPSLYSNLFGSVSFAIPPNSDSMFMVIASNLPTNMVLYSSALTYYGFNYIWRVTFVVSGGTHFILLIGVVSILISSVLKKNKVNSKALLSLTFSFLLELIAGLLALFGILFGIVRGYFTIAMVALSLINIPFVTWSLLKLKLTDSWTTTPPRWINFYLRGDSPLKRWYMFLEFLRVITLLAAVLIIVSYSSPVWVHAIVYAAFLILTTFALYLTFLLLRYSLQSESFNYGIELQGV